MTEQELTAMEQRDALTQKFDFIKTAQERWLLLQEVRRLRVLVERAYEEGGLQYQNWDSPKEREVLESEIHWDWQHSDAFKALEGEG